MDPPHFNPNPSISNPPSQAPPTHNTAYSFYQPAPPLASSRYNRQLLIPSISLSGQERISRSKVLIIGLGGLGSPASLYLAGSGVRTLGLLDDDIVEESNLHRQIVHRETWVGMSKARSALMGCMELNGGIEYVVHETRLEARNALDIIARYDVVLDCTDNPATRYLISDCCVVLGKTLVSGAAQKLEGQVVVLNYPIHGEGTVVCGRGPCYRCLFPHPPSPDMVKSCSEIGILGPVVGTIGTLMASEALRLVVRDGQEERKPTMLLYNAWSADPRCMFRVIGLRSRRKDCVVCGEDGVLTEKGLTRITADGIRTGSMDYDSWCGIAEDIKLLRDNERIDVREFLGKMTRSEDAVVVDVREPYEVELGPKIEGSINIPISQILRGTNQTVNGEKAVDELDNIVTGDEHAPIYFICPKGNDSQVAAQKLMDRISTRTKSDGIAVAPSKRWIGDVRGGFSALDRIVSSNSNTKRSPG